MKKGNVWLKNFAAGRKALGKRILVYGGTAIAVCEFLQMLVEALQKLFDIGFGEGKMQIPFYDTLTSTAMTIPFLLVALILAIIAQSGFSSYSKKITGTDIKVGVEVRDIFDCNGDIVVPCNNIFAYEDEMIGTKSIQHQLNVRCTTKTEDGSKLIGEQVNKALASAKFEASVLPNVSQEINGREYKIYPYGLMLPLTLKVGRKNRNFYLVSMSEIKEPGKPSVDNKVLLTSIDNMWQQIKEDKIAGDTLVIPIMGTGAAGMLEKPKQVISRYIIKTFADEAKKLGIRKLVLCVRPEAYVNDEINMELLRKYIDYLCEFPDSEFSVE